MRLWHKDLISVLPRQQLLSQWRECCCIARNIAINGTPNHILVNKIMRYDVNHFISYTNLIINEFTRRDYKINKEAFFKHIPKIINPNCITTIQCIYPYWHDDIYLRQCLYNLEEKYLCGGISQNEWELIHSKYSHLFELYIL